MFLLLKQDEKTSWKVVTDIEKELHPAVVGDAPDFLYSLMHQLHHDPDHLSVRIVDGHDVFFLITSARPPGKCQFGH